MGGDGWVVVEAGGAGEACALCGIGGSRCGWRCGDGDGWVSGHSGERGDEPPHTGTIRGKHGPCARVVRGQ